MLVVEDEPAISDVVSTALRYQGYEVKQLEDGVSGLSEAMRSSYDVLILDVNLPGLNGFDLCERLRQNGRSTPVLFLTARSDTEDRVKGFVRGGDDYLTKPFSVEELVLRVSAILRRTGTETSEVLAVHDLVVNAASHEVRRGGRSIDVTPTEFRLLHYLVINANVVLSKSQILVNVWDDDFDGTDNVVELYIGYLRRKLDDGGPPLIHTKRGVGYVLRPPDQ